MACSPAPSSSALSVSGTLSAPALEASRKHRALFTHYPLYPLCPLFLLLLSPVLPTSYDCLIPCLCPVLSSVLFISVLKMYFFPSYCPFPTELLLWGVISPTFLLL